MTNAVTQVTGSASGIGEADSQSAAAKHGAIAYVAAQHGLHRLCSAIDADYSAEGVRTKIAAAGAIDTPILRKTATNDDNSKALANELYAVHPAGRFGRPHEVAKNVAFLLFDQASFVAGAIVRVDGGLSSLVGGAPGA